MFKRNKHEFTCPDVIHLRTRHKKAVRANIAANVLGLTALLGYGWYADRKERFAPLPEYTEYPVS